MSAKLKIICAIALVAGFATVAVAQVTGPAFTPARELANGRAPIVGGEGPEADACGGIGRVATYEGDLAVHDGPDKYAREKDSLAPRTLVWLCEGGGEWQGIVYPKGEFQELGDCRVSSPIAEAKPYAGPCEHGWVIAANLQLVAG